MEKNNNEIDVPEIDAFTVFVKNAVEYAKKNKNYVIIGCIVFVIALLGISYTPVLIAEKNASAFASLSKSIDALYNEKDLSVEKVDNIFKPVNEKYSGTKASAFGDIYAARALYGIGEHEKAASHLQNAADFFEHSDLLWDLSEYELGCIYFDKNQEKSLKYFKDIASQESFIKEDALFYLGLAGDKDSLKKLVDDYPNSFYASIAKEKYESLK